MEIVLIIIFVAIVLMAGIFNRSTNNSSREFHPEKRDYSYSLKTVPMTKSEALFFHKLNKLCFDKYLVFPQAHLSSFIDHEVAGQNWSGAFKHINGKSVDYLLCDKTTLRPVYAIELDDPSHGRKDRQERDIEVERILHLVDLPLIRFSNTSVSGEEIISQLSEAMSVQS